MREVIFSLICLRDKEILANHFHALELGKCLILI